MRARLQDWVTVAFLICSCEFVVGMLPAQQKSAAPQGIDALTAPIALYPDALIAQVLDASTNPAEVQDFSKWLKENASLKGSELQEAASKANFDAAFIALALFPDVIHMMAQKPDWTQHLGEAFKADAQGVSKSIQRLRQQAQAMGNLKTNEQQQVVTQKGSGGDQVIVIQPANPQVVYVPQYNPQVVYVQPAPPPPPPSSHAAGAALIGFTAGIIVGAAVNNNNNYYHGPYAWHRPPGAAPYAYNAAALQNQRYNNAAALQNQRYNNTASLQNQRYNNTASLQQQRHNNASDLQNQRQADYQQNSAQRQAASQSNQAQRQSAVSSAQSQSTANQAQRQSAVSSAQSQSTANQAQRQSATSGAQPQA